MGLIWQTPLWWNKSTRYINYDTCDQRSNFDLGGLSIDNILKYQEVLKDCLQDYFIPPEATQVSEPFHQCQGALTANTQMMRDSGTLDKFPEVIKAMQEVVEKVAMEHRLHLFHNFIGNKPMQM